MAGFGERIREARKARNLNQHELAELLSKKLERRVPYETVYSYEKNRRKPPVDVLAAIADILGVSVDYLAGRSDSPYSSEPDSADDDLQAVVAAIFRAQKELSPDEKKRLINVLKAGWPEIFKNSSKEGND